MVVNASNVPGRHTHLHKLLRRLVRATLITASNLGRWRHFLMVEFVILFTLETGSRELFPLDTGSRACLHEIKNIPEIHSVVSNESNKLIRPDIIIIYIWTYSPQNGWENIFYDKDLTGRSTIILQKIPNVGIPHWHWIWTIKILRKIWTRFCSNIYTWVI